MSPEASAVMRPEMDLATVSLSTFTALLGEAFQEVGVADGLALTLVAVEALPVSAGPGRAEPFALVFTGPRQPVRPQGLRTLSHPASGRLDVFLVPTQPDAQGARYEAVFT